MPAGRVALVLYTTLYREGGEAFRRCARTLARELRARLPHDVRVIERATESKAAFVDALTTAGGVDGARIDAARIDAARIDAARIVELHFIGHSGMYGIMFGTTSWPEQLSPHEWRRLAEKGSVPFAEGAHAYFHACRTARWFTPFFARTFHVSASGYWWYTTISAKQRRYALDQGERDAWVVSVHGKKSGGLLASARKHALRGPLLPMTTTPPSRDVVDSSYDAVAALYDDTFADAAVRSDELAFLRRALRGAGASKPRVLDIGCGTGTFLRATRDLVEHAVGVDVSAQMIDRARERSRGDEAQLSFKVIDGPALPFADASFDVVTSMLSFRYLDWDPVVAEILRVLRPGGRLIVVDMVAAPLRAAQLPRFVVDKARQVATEALRPSYKRALQRMVQAPAWEHMLAYNPIRAEHELRWYLGSRFPGGEMRVINTGRHAQVLAFRSAPLYAKHVSPLSYP